MMIIQLNGLNFSNNNIGNISGAKDLSELTKKVLGNYSKTLTTSKQLAVDEFLTELQTEGLWAKIENLFMPCLAGNLSEVMYNVKKDKMETAPGSDYYYLENGSLKLNRIGKNVAIPAESIAQFKVNGSYMNIHYMVNTDPIEWYADAETDYDCSCYWLTTFTSAAYKGIMMAEGRANNRWNLLINGNPQRYVNPMTYPTITDIYEGTSIVTGRTDKDQGIYNNILGKMNYSETDDKTISDAATYVGVNYAKQEYCHIGGMRLFGTGFALTDDELKTYSNLCNTFIDKIYAE